MSLKNSGRYAVSEDEGYEAGSNHQVLKNHLGITSTEIMDQLEVRKFERTELAAFEKFSADYQFTINDICSLHKTWLGEIYYFAGKFRSVNMSKDGFPFAGASYISSCMKKFERDYLAKYTPCHFTNVDELAYALGVVHIEFILIHPFRAHCSPACNSYGITSRISAIRLWFNQSNNLFCRIQKIY